MSDLGRLQSIDAWFDAALELSAGQRTQFLADLAERDPDAAAAVERLLAALERTSPLDERPPMRLDPSFANQHDSGDRIAEYRLERRLGVGGMGEVWLATGPAGAVAVKLIRSELSAAVLGERMRRERDLLARVRHPNIAALLDSGLSETGEPYLVIEYVDGEPILQAAACGLSLRQRIEAVAAVAEAVAAAQAQLIVHRDIKPANILLTPDGQPKLLDFGIAKLLDQSGRGDSTTMTRAFGAALTPAYAAPEQRAGEAVTTATDVYGLGAVLHELLLGQRLTADKASRVAARGAAAPGIGLSPQQLARALKGDLDALIATATADDPRQRYPNADSLAADLRAYLSGAPLRAQPESFRYRIGKLIRRHRVASAVAGIAALAVLVAAAIAWQESIDARREAARARYVQAFIESVMAADLPGSVRDDLPTTAELLARGSALAISDSSADPDARLALLQSLTRIQRSHRAWADAGQLIEAALALLPETNAPHWQRAALEAELAAVEYAQQPGPDARQRLLAAFEAAVAVGAPADWQAVALRALINADVDSDEGDAARRHAERLLTVADGDPDSRIGALTQAVVAYAFDQQFRPRALELANAAYDLARRHYGDQHAQTAYAAMRLGNVLRIQGDIDGAADRLDDAAAIARRAYPANHPQLARIVEELARVRVRQLRLADGVALWREVLAMRVAHDGADSFSAARSATFLAAALLRTGAIDEAATLAQDSHAKLVEQVGVDNALTLDAASYAASALIERGEPDRATALLPDLGSPIPPSIGATSRWRYRELQLLRIETLPAAGRAAHLQRWLTLADADESTPRETGLMLLNAASLAIDSDLPPIAASALAAAERRIEQDGDSTQQSEIVALLRAILANAPAAELRAGRERLAARRGERHFAVRSVDRWLQQRR